MNSREFLGRERELARRYGLRKSDVLFQMVRCLECGTESLLRSRFNRHEFTSIASAEQRVLEVIRRPVKVVCTKCSGASLDTFGSRHVFLMYSEREHAHLALTLRMTREDDGRVKVRRQVWLVPDEGTAEEVEVEDERIESFWLDSRIRARATLDDADSAAAALDALRAEIEDDPYLLRELGNCLVDAGRTGRAVAAYEASLELDPDQPGTSIRAGRLLFGFGDYEAATRRLFGAWESSADPALLIDVIRAAYRGRQFQVMIRAADLLRAIDHESLAAQRAFAVVATAADVGDLREACTALRSAAALAGDRTVELVAEYWSGVLSLPIPDWTEKTSRAAYLTALGEELRDWGLEVAEPDPLQWVGGEIALDLQAVADDGTTWVFAVFDQEPTPALFQTICATARAVRADERLAGARLVPLNRHPIGWGAMLAASGTPEANVLLEADADTTMAVDDENVSGFVVAAERHFGRPMDFGLDSLDEVDAILQRLHADGFGEITFGLQCQVAAYVGAVLRRVLDGSAWQAADPPMDPVVFTLASGEEINLVTKVGKAVRNGPEDSLAHLCAVILDSVTSS